MDEFSDINFDMGEEPLSDEEIEALIKGKVDPSFTFGAVSHIAELISAAKMPATDEELATQEAVVNSFRLAAGPHSVRNIRYEKKQKVHSGLLAAKIAGVLMAATALTGTAVAAYHGDLPGTFQTTVSNGLAHVGISVPDTHASSGPPSTSNQLPPLSGQSKNLSSGTVETTTTRGVGGGIANGADQGLANQDSVYGLCVAYQNFTGSVSSFPFATSTSSTTSTTSTTQVSGTTAAGRGAISQVSSATAFQRLEALATQNGESVSQLCNNAPQPGKQGPAKSDRSGTSRDKHPNSSNTSGEAPPYISTTTTTASNGSYSVQGSRAADRSQSSFNGNPFSQLFKGGEVYGNGRSSLNLSRWSH